MFWDEILMKTTYINDNVESIPWKYTCILGFLPVIVVKLTSHWHNDMAAYRG